MHSSYYKNGFQNMYRVLKNKYVLKNKRYMFPKPSRGYNKNASLL